MAERSNAAVLKTVDCNRSGGSNPSLSATYIRKRRSVKDLRFLLRAGEQKGEQIFRNLSPIWYNRANVRLLAEVAALAAQKLNKDIEFTNCLSVSSLFVQPLFWQAIVSGACWWWTNSNVNHGCHNIVVIEGIWFSWAIAGIPVGFDLFCFWTIC